MSIQENTTALRSLLDMAYALPKAGSGGVSIELLWTNASPSSSFAAQSVSVDLTECSMVIITMYQGTESGNLSATWIVPKGAFAMLSIVNGASSIGTVSYFRQATVNDNSVSFGKGYRCKETELEDNEYAIPAAIYGIKG